MRAGSTTDMFEPPANASTGGYLKITDSSGLTQGSTLRVADASGAIVAAYTVTNSGMQLVLLSNTALVKGQSYTVTFTDAMGEWRLGEYIAV